ncbi:alpha/beta hydrolase [uncultured Hymenobacter sp.]|uniref:alpha/beta hydrolase n=1 Tax=uncultured Hymenobacter sp. TaxID=170016 RepID=UPI0035CB0377
MNIFRAARPLWRRLVGHLAWALAAMLALFAFIIFNQSYRFTHFDAEAVPATSGKPSGFTLAKYALLGLPNSRPVDGPAPDTTYQNVRLTAADSTHLAAWYVPVAQSRGTVALFHGYHSQRAGLNLEAVGFRRLGFSTLQVDFRGSGASDGNFSSVGYEEGQDVKAAYDWLARQQPAGEIYLYGMSMGAVSVLRGLSQHPQMQPAGLILECPFATILDASKGRLRSLKIPEEPLSHLIVFTGSLQNGFWGFSHDAVAYARAVRVPTLLQWGERDPRVTHAETDAIFAALQGPKQLVTYPTAQHESYARRDPARWQQAVAAFLSK